MPLTQARPGPSAEEVGDEGCPRTEAQARALYQALLDGHPEPTFSLDPDGVVRDCNVALARFMGRPVEAILGLTIDALMTPAFAEAARMAWARARGGRTQSWQAEFEGPDGTISLGHVTLAPVMLDGVFAGAQGVARDVTAYRVIEEQLQARVFSDPLTGLANRAQLVEAIARACRTAPTPSQVAALFLDLDDFKQVNDALGHAAGDTLLVEVATRLRRATRGADLVARLGGDEFAVLLDGLHAMNDVQTVVARIMSALQVPVEISGRVVHPLGSLGIATWDGVATPAELLRNADLAMYRAKQLGKGRYARYDATMHAEARERLDLASDLRRALCEEALHGPTPTGTVEAAFQPVVEIATGRVVKYEALARWAHPTRGPIAPSVFVPLAEESGLIAALGRRMLVLGCERLRRLQDDARAAGLPIAEAPGVAVNVSGRQLMRGTLVATVREVLATTGADAQGLTLEITESVAMSDPQAVLALLHELTALGVRIALDDFGTGYSSLSHLLRFPLHIIKVDKSFVDGLACTEPPPGGMTEAMVASGVFPGCDPHAVALLRTMVQLARSLDLRLVAEGVETLCQRRVLLALGCELAQGYLFGRPELPADHGR